MDLTRYAALFAAEAQDALGTCTRLLLAWERAPAEAPIDELFRTLHNLKGMAATMGYEALAADAHALESALAEVRAGAAPADAALLDRLLNGVRGLETGVAAATGGAASGLSAAAPAPVSEGSVADAAPVRVARSRLDRMGRLAAELEVARHRLVRFAEQRSDPQLEERVTAVSRVAGRLADEVGAARLVPVAELFARLPLALRDAAKALERSARLETEGDAVEADRAVLESLAEPLVHLVRNAVGHGIEPARLRKKAGKPAEGVVRVVARRDRSSLVLAVSDDGAGVDRAAVAARAERDGLPDAAFVATDDDVLLAVLARPGFSTASETSSVSGRGVGVDAVLNAVRRLRGTVQLQSTPGQGTIWTVRVPVGAAAVRAILAEADGVRVALPFPAVREAARLAGHDGDQVEVRGRRVPLRSLRALLGRPPRAGTGRMPAVVIGGARGEVALAVDALLGQQEILVETFPAPAGMPAWVDGAAVLADGGTALVLAPGALG